MTMSKWKLKSAEKYMCYQCFVMEREREEGRVFPTVFSYENSIGGR